MNKNHSISYLVSATLNLDLVLFAIVLCRISGVAASCCSYNSQDSVDPAAQVPGLS